MRTLLLALAVAAVIGISAQPADAYRARKGCYEIGTVTCVRGRGPPSDFILGSPRGIPSTIAPAPRMSIPAAATRPIRTGRATLSRRKATAESLFWVKR